MPETLIGTYSKRNPDGTFQMSRPITKNGESDEYVERAARLFAEHFRLYLENGGEI